MTLYITEAEMLERYIDALKRSCSKAKEITIEAIEKRPQIFVDFIEGIKTAAGSAHQLAHAQMNPKWLSARDILESVIPIAHSQTTFTDADKPLWHQIIVSLEQMAVTGRKLATMKAIKKSDIVNLLDYREKHAETLN